MAVYKIHTDELPEMAAILCAGDEIMISGVIYTARDAAHRKIVEQIEIGKALPFTLKNAVIYYAGPTEARPGQIVGSCGPTTSGRMDRFSPLLMAHGVKGMIGKGARSRPVLDALKTFQAVYFAAAGGAGAMIADCIKALEVVAFPELGCESVKRLRVEALPVVCACDAYGGDLYVSGTRNYRAI